MAWWVDRLIGWPHTSAVVPTQGLFRQAAPWPSNSSGYFSWIPTKLIPHQFCSARFWSAAIRGWEHSKAGTTMPRARHYARSRPWLLAIVLVAVVPACGPGKTNWVPRRWQKSEKFESDQRDKTHCKTGREKPTLSDRRLPIATATRSTWNAGQRHCCMWSGTVVELMN